MLSAAMCYILPMTEHTVVGADCDACKQVVEGTLAAGARSAKAWQMRLEDIEKENPSILRLLAEETIRRLYDYERGNYPISWLKGIQADFVNAIHTWAEGCLSDAAKRTALKAAVKDVVFAIRKGEIGERNSESMERIYELLVTINVINEALNYIYDVMGQEVLDHAVEQIYNLKKITEWKRKVLNGSRLTDKEVAIEKAIMTEAEISAETPEAIAAVLEERIKTINLRLLTDQGRDEVIQNYSLRCEKHGFDRNAILENGLAEAAEMLNQLFALIAAEKSRQATATVDPTD